MALVSETEKRDAGEASQAGPGILRKLTPLVGILAFLLAWQLVVVLWKMPPYLLPSPIAVAVTFVNELPDLLRVPTGPGLGVDLSEAVRDAMTTAAQSPVALPA